MKRLALLGVFFLALIALGAASTIAVVDTGARWMKSGFYVGLTPGKTSTNRVSNIIFGSQVAQFYTDGGLGCTLPQDAGVTSVVGAQVGDFCNVVMPALSHPGSKVDCSVLVADQAQLRHCALQANVDAGPLTYKVEVISNQ